MNPRYTEEWKYVGYIFRGYAGGADDDNLSADYVTVDLSDAEDVSRIFEKHLLPDVIMNEHSFVVNLSWGIDRILSMDSVAVEASLEGMFSSDLAPFNQQGKYYEFLGHVNACIKKRFNITDSPSDPGE